MTLLECIVEDGIIILDPAGKQNGQHLTGGVSPEWFVQNYPDLATATLPLTQEHFEKLKNIDKYWTQNAERWRSEGLI